MSFIVLNQVDFSYSPKANQVLKGINLSLEREGITAVVGPNGSGKTTLTRVMIGINKPTGGQVYLEGRPINEYSLAEIGRRIGYVFQNPDLQLFCSTVAEEIGFGLINQGCDPAMAEKKVEFYLNYFELTGYRNTFPMRLSRGEKQRLVIAAVLAHEPGYLILDEPTVGLDAYRKKLLEDILRKVDCLGRGMLLVSHDDYFVERLADRIICMENGLIKSDSGERKTGYDS